MENRRGRERPPLGRSLGGYQDLLPNGSVFMNYASCATTPLRDTYEAESPRCVITRTERRQGVWGPGHKKGRAVEC